MGAEGGGSGKLNIDMINSTLQNTALFWNNKKVIAQSSVYDFLLSSQHSLCSLLFFFPILRLSGVKGCSFAFSQKKGGLTFLDVPYRLP